MDAAAVPFKGITAQYLLKSTYPVGPGTIIVLYGVAGGVGQIMTRWAKHLGAFVIGIVSKQDSVALAETCLMVKWSDWRGSKREADMKAVRYYGKEDIRVEEVAAPTGPGPKQIVVKPKVCGICGTDLHRLQPPRQSSTLPISTWPLSRNRESPSQRVSAYRIASAIVYFPETVTSWASSQALSASMSGILRENRTR